MQYLQSNCSVQNGIYALKKAHKIMCSTPSLSGFPNCYN